MSLRISAATFLPHDAMLARYMLWPCVCVCLYLSVTSGSSTEMAGRRITQTIPHDSPGIPVSVAKDLPEIRPGSPPAGAPNAGGVVKIGDFRQITGYISKTVQDRRLVSIKVE